MKNILILGVGRAGKSTLSRMIKDRFPEYDLIHTDSIRNAILYNIDETFFISFQFAALHNGICTSPDLYKTLAREA